MSNLFDVNIYALSNSDSPLPPPSCTKMGVYLYWQVLKHLTPATLRAPLSYHPKILVRQHSPSNHPSSTLSPMSTSISRVTLSTITQGGSTAAPATQAALSLSSTSLGSHTITRGYWSGSTATTATQVPNTVTQLGCWWLAQPHIPRYCSGNNPTYLPKVFVQSA